MIEILQTVGLPAAVVFLIAVGGFFAKEIWGLFAAHRLQSIQSVQSRVIEQYDRQLEEFYLPLRQRFLLSGLLNATTMQWQMNQAYVNDALHIISDDPRALRKIVVRKMFMPYNKDIEDLILNKSHLIAHHDETQYEIILQHFVIWSSLEAGLCEGSIQDYNANHLLKFPIEEVRKHYAACERVMNERDILLEKMQSIAWVSSKRNRHRKQERRKNNEGENQGSDSEPKRDVVQ